MSLNHDGEFTLKNVISTSPKSLYIREKATVDIPGRKKLPTSVKFVYDNMDIPETQAILINVNPGMEYTNNKAEGWTSFTGETLTIDIPEKAQEARFAGLTFTGMFLCRIDESGKLCYNRNT